MLCLFPVWSFSVSEFFVVFIKLSIIFHNHILKEVLQLIWSHSNIFPVWSFCISSIKVVQRKHAYNSIILNNLKDLKFMWRWKMELYVSTYESIVLKRAEDDYAWLRQLVATLTKTVKFPQNLRSKWRGDCALAVMISNKVK